MQCVEWSVMLEREVLEIGTSTLMEPSAPSNAQMLLFQFLKHPCPTLRPGSQCPDIQAHQHLDPEVLVMVA